MNWTKDIFSISTDKSRLDVHYIHQYLSEYSHWAKNIPLHIVKKSIEGSMCFGLYTSSQQIGFARVITDNACFAYLADVFVDERFRGKGLAKWLMEIIIVHPDLQGLRRFLLSTRDAHGLYKQFGFLPLASPENWMLISNPDPYKKNVLPID